MIEDISYFTTGCGFGTATCSLVVEIAKGKTVDEAAAITAAEIESQLDGYPEKKKDYPERALEACTSRIADYREESLRPERFRTTPQCRGCHLRRNTNPLPQRPQATATAATPARSSSNSADGSQRPPDPSTQPVLSERSDSKGSGLRFAQALRMTVPTSTPQGDNAPLSAATSNLVARGVGLGFEDGLEER